MPTEKAWLQSTACVLVRYTVCISRDGHCFYGAVIFDCVVCRCVEILISEQFRRYTEKMQNIQELEYAEALAVNQLKLRRQNTVRENYKAERRCIVK